MVSLLNIYEWNTQYIKEDNAIHIIKYIIKSYFFFGNTKKIFEQNNS